MPLALLIIVILAFSSFTQAQERCGTRTPQTGTFENWISSKIRLKGLESARRDRTIYQIPVVVHVLHQGEATGSGANLSFVRIKGQIDSLNVDFRRLNADTVNTPGKFLPVAADAEIEFVLAKQNPRGHPTSGISRVEVPRAYNPKVTDDLIEIRSLSYWPADKYLNIYVGQLRGGISILFGYAIFPETDLVGVSEDADRLYLDAVFVDHRFFGNNVVRLRNRDFESRGRTLTHEIGHFLSLRHIWGDAGCEFDDFVDDTPEADTDNERYTSPCAFPNPNDEVVCVPNEPEMFQNYMDYTDDICMNLFTEGQKIRMRTVLENSPRRNSLLSSNGLNEVSRFENDLAATGVLSPKPAECSGQFTPAVELTNWGTDTISSYRVGLNINGLLISLQDIDKTLAPYEKDTVMFPNQIIRSLPYSITFRIAGVDGTVDGNNLNNLISQTVKYNSSISLPLSETFSSGTTELLGLIGSSHIWRIAHAPREIADNKALVFKAFGNPLPYGEEVILKTPTLDFNGIPSAELSFSYAYANDINNYTDGLIIKVSSDCGATFSETIFSLIGPDLETASNTSDEFTPSTILDWRDTVIGVSTFRDLEEVQFQFIGLNGGSNNIYLDNILIKETNLAENDISLRSLEGPLLTCSENTNLTLQVRNAGALPITSFKYQYDLNGKSVTDSVSGIKIAERAYYSLKIRDVGPLLEKENKFTIEVLSVNNSEDKSDFGNSISSTTQLDLSKDEFPLVLDFESSNNWVAVSPTGVNLWGEFTLAQNGTLRANAFDEENLGIESWFISPELSTGGLDSVGLYFRASYGQRKGFNDLLSIFISNDCGETYLKNTPVFQADSDSLSTALTDERWIPASTQDWKEYEIDLQPFITNIEDIRLAFVFLNGNGNDLYIDDIHIRGNDLPTHEVSFLLFPNPSAVGNDINLSFNFQQKQEIMVQILSTGGKLVFQKNITNALNQVITLNAPGEPGLYFVSISGNNFVSTQKLFVSL